MIKLKTGYSWNTVQENVAALTGDGMHRLNAVAVAYAFARKCYFGKYRNGALPSWLAKPHTHRMRSHYDKYYKPLYADGGDLQPGEFERNPYKNWKKVVGSKIGRLTPQQALAVIDEYNAETKAASGQTIHHQTIRELTGGLNSQSINMYVLRKLVHKANKTITGRGFKRNPSPAPNQTNLHRAAKLYREFTGRKADGVKRFSLPKIPREGLVFGELVQVGYRSARDGKLYVHPFRAKSRPSLISSFDGKLVLIVGGRYAFTERGIVDR